MIALAGFVDAIVGGGGLVLVPALFAVYPTALPATLLGTNKGGAVWGTAWASVQYARRVVLPWHALAPAMAAALAGSFVGAWAVTQVSADSLKRALPFLLAAILVYTVARKELGRHHAPRWQGRREAVAAAVLAGVLGFYDGFFGPGTGSLFVFLFVRLMGYDFLNASASAELLTTATNAAKSQNSGTLFRLNCAQIAMADQIKSEMTMARFAPILLAITPNNSAPNPTATRLARRTSFLVPPSSIRSRYLLSNIK